MGGKLLEIEELSVAFRGLRGATEVLSRQLRGRARRDRRHVGESGSEIRDGAAIMRCWARRLITAGHVRFEGRDLAPSQAELLRCAAGASAWCSRSR